MKEERFQELLASVREGGAILRGEAEPSRACGDVEVILRVRVKVAAVPTAHAEEVRRMLPDLVRRAANSGFFGRDVIRSHGDQPWGQVLGYPSEWEVLDDPDDGADPGDPG